MYISINQMFLILKYRWRLCLKLCVIVFVFINDENATKVLIFGLFIMLFYDFLILLILLDAIFYIFMKVEIWRIWEIFRRSHGFKGHFMLDFVKFIIGVHLICFQFKNNNMRGLIRHPNKIPRLVHDIGDKLDPHDTDPTTPILLLQSLDNCLTSYPPIPITFL